MSNSSSSGSSRVKSLPVERAGPNDGPHQRPHFRRDGSGPTPRPIPHRPNPPRAAWAGGDEYQVPDFARRNGALAINARQRAAQREELLDDRGAAGGWGWIVGIAAALIVGWLALAALNDRGNAASGSTGRVASPAQFTASYTSPVTSGFSSGSSPALPFGVTSPTNPMSPFGTTNQLNPMPASQFDPFNQANQTTRVNPMSPSGSVNRVSQPTIGVPGRQLSNTSFGSGGSRGGTSSFGSGSGGFLGGSFGSVGSPSTPGFP